MRAEHPVFRRRRFFNGLGGGDDLGDIEWFAPSGEHMTGDDWGGHARSITVFLNGEAIKEPDMRGEPVVDDSFLLLCNADHEDVTFTVPPEMYGKSWEYLIDTNAVDVANREALAATEDVTLPAHSLLVLRKAE